MKTPEKIADLVKQFERNLKAYKNPNYKEAQLRQEFINPFFNELGWDVYNEDGAAPQYRDVIMEDSIKVAGGTKAPDYCFALSGRKIFFVEAKKPSINIYKNPEPAFQLRRYAWSSKLPLAILTDFEELAIYDTRYKPKKTDRANVNRIRYFTFKEYVENWEEIYNIFSYDAVKNGSFDNFAESTKKRGTTEVDDEFLSEIEKWRDLFAKNIALRNKEKNLDVEDLNYAVQQIIDRIIFLRMGEDRGIEKYGTLESLIKERNIYRKFCDLCLEADEKYNSGLFHFNEEKDRITAPDQLTPGLVIDDGIFKIILKSIYYPESPYEFSAISPEILGNVYEQFLGKVIRLTPKGMVKIEEKPEVQKSGGVYYTPQFIVDYIVKNIINDLCKNKSPNKVSKLRILDPACGSGSFLLGAYSELLKWHLNYYINLKTKERLEDDKISRGQDGEWYLTIKEKKRILTNNIYGVDIDTQAVEVTKLSLLLKVLEGENKDVIEAQQKLFKERALPDLDENIKCGNSLIGLDFYNLSETDLAEENEKRVNPFDWEDGFPEIMANGGFDAIIGNPPYIRIQAMKEWAPQEVNFYEKKYDSASGSYDIYTIFIERALNLLNDKGLLGFIVSHKFFKRGYGKPLRKLIAENKYLTHVVHFGDQQVFKKITTYTCLLFLNKKGSDNFYYVEAHDLPLWKLKQEAPGGKVKAKRVTANPWSFLIGPPGKLLDKLDDKFPTKLDNITNRIFQGFKTSGDDIYIVEEITKDSGKVKIFSKEKQSEYWLEPDLLYPLVKGGNSNPYYLTPTTKRIIFPYTVNENSAELIAEPILKGNYPLTWTYLRDNKKYLEQRDKGKLRGEKWFAYSRNQALKIMANPKIFVPDVANCASYSLDKTGNNFFTGGAAGGYGILVKENYPIEYILGLLNSAILDWYVLNTSTEMRGGYYSFEKPFIRGLPIKTIDYTNSDEIALRDKIISLVNQILHLHEKMANTKIPSEITRIQRQIDYNKDSINNVVYELYKLTKEEIKIIKDFHQRRKYD